MKENETKREKFIRLAENRTNKIIDTLELLSNLSNTRAYEYSQKDVDKMFTAIQNALNDAKRSYNKQDTSKTKRFSFNK